MKKLIILFIIGIFALGACDPWKALHHCGVVIKNNSKDTIYVIAAANLEDRVSYIYSGLLTPTDSGFIAIRSLKIWPGGEMEYPIDTHEDSICIPIGNQEPGWNWGDYFSKHTNNSFYIVTALKEEYLWEWLKTRDESKLRDIFLFDRSNLDLKQAFTRIYIK